MGKKIADDHAFQALWTAVNELQDGYSRLREQVNELRADHSECGRDLGALQGELTVLKASSNVRVAEQMTARVAWYEDKTRLVLAAMNTTGPAPRAEGVHCERCHKQVEEADVVAHLVAHTNEEFLPIVKPKRRRRPRPTDTEMTEAY